MLAKSADGYRIRIEMCLSAAHYAERILLLTIDAANAGAAMAEYEQLNDEEKVKCGGLHAFVESHSKPYSTPYRMQDWSEYSLSENMLMSCKNVPSNHARNVVSKSTVTKAPLTINHLFYTSDLLCGEGLTLQALPLLITAELISQLATNTRNENLIALCGAKTARALANLGKPLMMSSRLSACGPYGLDESSARKYKEDVEQIELQRYGRILTNGDPSSDDSPTKSMVYFADNVGTVENARKVKLNSFEVRRLWVDIANEMVNLEQPNTAAQYVEEALRHSSAFDDLACRAKCLVVKAKVAMMNGNVNECTESCKLARMALKNFGGGESIEWTEATLLMASAISGPPYYARGEAKKILENAHQVLRKRMRSVPEMMRVAAGDAAFADNNAEIDLDVLQSRTLVCKAYAESLVNEALLSRANSSPWWDTWSECLDIIRECCNDLATLSNGADGLVEPDNIRPPQLLVDMLELHSQLILRMKPSDDYMDDLKTSISLLSRASKIALECYAFSSPPEHTEQQALVVKQPDSSDTGGEVNPGTEDEPAKKGALDGSLPPMAAKVTLPTARRAANIQISLCRLCIAVARRKNEHISSKEAEEAYKREVTDPVVKYLDATAPVALKDSDVKVQNLQSALFCATSARRLAKYCPRIISAANALVGECLGLLSSQRGQLNMAWDTSLSVSASTTSLGEGSLTPSPSAAELVAGAAATGKKGGKNKGGKAKAAEPVIDKSEDDNTTFNIDEFDVEVTIDESGDIRSQALSLLTAAGNSLAELGSFGPALDAYMCACDVSGSAVGNEGDPVSALRSLLKAQAAGSSEWLRDVRMKSSETEPLMRDRIFSRMIDRTERDRGSLSSCLEDMSFQPLLGGNHGAGSQTFAQAKAARKYLKRFSTSWKRNMCYGSSGDAFVDDLLVSLPDDVNFLVLQLSGDGTSIYCGVASKSNLPAIAKTTLSEVEVAKLADLIVKMKTVESSGFAKFMIRYADESGEDGDFVSAKEGGSSAPDKGEGLFISDDGESDIRDVINGMNALMAAIFSKPQIAKALEGAVESESNIVIIPDVRLQLLPLEALDCLTKVKSVSRDFNAQIFLSRLASYAACGPPTGKSTKYIADPRHEDRGSENASKPRKTVHEVVEGLCGKAGAASAFSGILGTEKIPSVGDWQNLLAGDNLEDASVSSRSFLYFGPGRCLARFAPNNLVGLNIDNCQMVVLVDRAENDASYRRQSKLDNQKRPGHLSLENALETAALFSLSGANCVVLNRWANSFHANGLLVNTFYENLLGTACTVSEAIQRYRSLSLPSAAAGGHDGDAETNEDKSESLAGAGVGGLKARVKYNTIVIGLPHMMLTK